MRGVRDGAVIQLDFEALVLDGSVPENINPVISLGRRNFNTADCAISKEVE